MSSKNDELWKQFDNPINFPVVISIPAAQTPGIFQSGSANEPIVTVQLDTLGGSVFHLPLSEKAAEGMLVILSNMLQSHNFQTPPESSGPPKSH